MDILSINELCGYINALLVSDPVLGDVWVQGEVSNCKRHTSGHWYLTLKEGEARIDAVMWRSSAARLTMVPRDGMAIMAHGKVEMYNGRIQVYLDFMRPAGEGILQAQFERLKAQLESEGLFDRKRPLPAHPCRIGIVTSPTGAALRDMLNVLSRRYPLCELIVSPALVQGDGSAESVVEALYLLYETDVDVIIVARGGGSIEDLWSFNEEIVARAIFAAPVPVVTGVGHETDTTIVDYVSDLRAPTPSAAAELVTPNITDMQDDLQLMWGNLNSLMLYQVQTYRSTLQTSIQQVERNAPLSHVRVQQTDVQRLHERAQRAMTRQIELLKLRVTSAQRGLRALSPTQTLQRGYAVVLNADGVAVTDPAMVQPHDRLQIRVKGGEFGAVVE